MRKNCSQVVLENFFEPCILFLLIKKPSYGYDLKKQLKETYNCQINIGNLYRCLNRLKKNGYINRHQEKGIKGPKRYDYTITAKGKKYLAGWIADLKKQNKIISLLIKNYQKYL
jgi:PadR family transcriptional regulator PadR